MATAMIRHGRSSQGHKQAQDGFSLLEVVISMAVLTVGLVSLLGVFGLAMASTLTSQEDMVAKQLANETYESIVTARNTSQINWDDIQNTGSTSCPVTNASSCGIFLNGATPIYNSGADGIFGTADDAIAGQQILRDPGPDGIFGTADDVFIPMTGYQRTIVIAPVLDSLLNPIATLRSITITMQYSTSQTKLPKTYILNSYISEFQ
jgi:prepilin-type N-terminal cleavage/methylation domain-containing protein